jgi:hypothetical protein
MDQEKIIEITTLEQLVEISGVSVGGGSIEGTAGVQSRPPISTKKEISKGNKKEKENQELKGKKMSEEEITLREHIRKKLKKQIFEQKQQEDSLRLIVRKMLKEGDLSDTHPNRSTGINTLEDVLKKSIPTLRTDYKKLTTDKKQRDSFRAHIINAVIDALKPEEVNASYLQGDPSGAGSALMAEPTSGELSDDEDLAALEEADIEVDIQGDDDKKIPVEKDDEPSPEEEFGSGLEDRDETGRNHAYTSYRKISQYILDAYDSLANPKDKQVFLDYLVTNLKLYFDKFEDELQSTIEEPSTPEYDQAKSEA